MDYFDKHNARILPHRKLIKFFFFVILSFCFCANLLNASGGYDNGTATGKGRLGLDLTWNPINLFPQGQSYFVMAYGFTDKFDIHGYYSIPVNGSDNYYFGLFYQFYKNKYLDLASAIGLRQYIPKSNRHLFAPQILYTINVFNGLRIGGSLVELRDIDRKNKNIGISSDISLIIPLFKNRLKNGIVNSLDFCIGVFRPVLWKPNDRKWHPTYSIDIIF